MLILNYVESPCTGEGCNVEHSENIMLNTTELIIYITLILLILVAITCVIKFYMKRKNIIDEESK